MNIREWVNEKKTIHIETHETPQHKHKSNTQHTKTTSLYTSMQIVKQTKNLVMHESIRVTFFHIYEQGYTHFACGREMPVQMSPTNLQTVCTQYFLRKSARHTRHKHNILQVECDVGGLMGQSSAQYPRSRRAQDP